VSYQCFNEVEKCFEENSWKEKQIKQKELVSLTESSDWLFAYEN